MEGAEVGAELWGQELLPIATLRGDMRRVTQGGWHEKDVMPQPMLAAGQSAGRKADTRQVTVSPVPIPATDQVSSFPYARVKCPQGGRARGGHTQQVMTTPLFNLLPTAGSPPFSHAPIATCPPPWVLQPPWHCWLCAPVNQQPHLHVTLFPQLPPHPPALTPTMSPPPPLPCCARAAWRPGTCLPRGACLSSHPPPSAGSGTGRCRLPAGSPSAGWAAGGVPARPSRRRASPAPARRAARTSAACTCGTPVGRSPTFAPAASPPRSGPHPPPRPPRRHRRAPPAPALGFRGGG